MLFSEGCAYVRQAVTPTEGSSQATKLPAESLCCVFAKPCRTLYTTGRASALDCVCACPFACKAIFQSKQEINYRLHEQIAQARAEQQRTNAKLKWELQRRHMADRVGKYVGLDDVSGGYIPGECSQKQDGQKSCRNSFTCKHKKASCRVQVKVST